MKFPSLLGWLLMGAAFIAAAAETVAHTVPGISGLVISAHDLWYTLSPKGLVIARIIVSKGISTPSSGTPCWSPSCSFQPG